MINFKRIDRTIFGILLLVATITLLDVYEDLSLGASLYHIIPEVMTVISVCIISTVFIYRCFKEKNMHVKQLQTDLSYAGFDAEQSKQRLNELKQSVTVAMNKQFDLWHLSQAESDIALFLLKGLSLKEIATLRKCSISTVRHQASMVYQKSGLEGRAQLSSFFIEELLSDDNLDTFQQLT